MLHTKATFAGPCVAHQIPFAGTELHFHFFPVTTRDQDLAFGLAPFLAAAEAWGVGQASSFTVLGAPNAWNHDCQELLPQQCPYGELQSHHASAKSTGCFR